MKLVILSKPDTTYIHISLTIGVMQYRGWSGGAMVLGKFPVPGCPTNFDYSRTRANSLTVGAGGGCMDIFSLIYHFSLLSPSLWETPDID